MRIMVVGKAVVHTVMHFAVKDLNKVGYKICRFRNTNTTAFCSYSFKIKQKS
jgi:hypothetical protein